MPAHRLRRFVRPEFFGKIDTVTLAQLLRPYGDYLRPRGVDPDQPRDLADLSAVVNLFLNPDDEMPTTLLHAVSMLDELASPIVMDELLAQGLIKAGDDKVPADELVQLWLEKPDVVAQKHRERQISRTRSYLVCRPLGSTMPWVDKPPEEGILALQDALSRWFGSSNRSPYVDFQMFSNPAEIIFLIRRGQSLRREEEIKEQSRKHFTFRPLRNDIVVFAKESRRLRVHAETFPQARAYIRMFSNHLFGNESFFLEMPHYTLQPLRDAGPLSLACSDIDGIDVIKLVELELSFAGRNGESLVYRAKDLMQTFSTFEGGFPSAGWPAAAKFAVKFADVKAARIVEVRPPNIANYLRDGDSGLVELWLAMRGFLLGDDGTILASA